MKQTSKNINLANYHFWSKNGEYYIPNVPSANEVKNKGMNLGEFQNIVLQKTEEQTLYIIELQKQIDLLRKEVEQLKNN